MGLVVKIKRFVAKDMRSALAQIKEELGSDAVIMSNKRVAEGVELMAAVDNNVEITATKLPAPTVTPSENRTAVKANDSFERSIKNDVVNIGQNNPLTNPSLQDRMSGENVTLPSDSLSALLNRQVQQAPANNRPGVNQAQHDKIAQAAAKLAQNKTSTSEQIPASTQPNDIELQFKSFTDRLVQSSDQTTNQYQQVSANQQHSKSSEINSLPTQNVNNDDFEKIE